MVVMFHYQGYLSIVEVHPLVRLFQDILSQAGTTIMLLFGVTLTNEQNL